MGIADSGTWAVVVSGTNKWIGKFANKRYEVVERFGEGWSLTLDNALDFIAMTMPLRNRDGSLAGVSKDPVVMPLDFTTYPMRLTVRAEAIYFFEDMQKEDQETYKQFVEMANDQMLQSRAARAGLILGGTDAGHPQKPGRPV